MPIHEPRMETKFNDKRCESRQSQRLGASYIYLPGPRGRVATYLTQSMPTDDIIEASGAKCASPHGDALASTAHLLTNSQHRGKCTDRQHETQHKQHEQHGWLWKCQPNNDSSPTSAAGEDI